MDPGEEKIRVGFWQWLVGIVWTDVRKLTPKEYELKFRIAELEATVDNRDQQIRNQKLQIDTFASEAAIKDLEIRGLTEIIARNQKRVEAETATAVRAAVAAQETADALLRTAQG